MIERLHQTLKNALTASGSVHWSTKLPLVLLALRSTVKTDIGLPPAEMVYGTTLRLPGELFHPAPTRERPPELIAALHNAMAQLRPTPGTDHNTKPPIFVPGELSNVSHVFLRIDATRPPLQPRYEGPYALLERREKTFKLQCSNRQVWVSVDRLKPADHPYATNSVNAVKKAKQTN
ncbi:uncharacterized protein LOC126553279 [Aphis gossypii]|uniref:uncharacterized protein LOC126553279 n=1 Tax=Aphis gossypii TaxID=80765 RepID=UPI002158ADBD|nr:uncharacterized protein LOC126553279 [Aphis gossypii]